MRRRSTSPRSTATASAPCTGAPSSAPGARGRSSLMDRGAPTWPPGPPIAWNTPAELERWRPSIDRLIDRGPRYGPRSPNGSGRPGGAVAPLDIARDGSSVLAPVVRRETAVQVPTHHGGQLFHRPAAVHRL